MATQRLAHPHWCQDRDLEERLFENSAASWAIHVGRPINIGDIVLRLTRIDVDGKPGDDRVSIRCRDMEDLPLDKARQLADPGQLNELGEALLHLTEEAKRSGE